MAEYDFDQWSVVSFITKKVVCVLIYGETVYIFCYTDVQIFKQNSEKIYQIHWNEITELLSITSVALDVR